MMKIQDIVGFNIFSTGSPRLLNTVRSCKCVWKSKCM